MKRIISLAVIALVAMTVKLWAQSVNDIEKSIKYQEWLVEDKQDSIKELDSQIKILKERVDSLNKATKNVKDQISALEKAKKEHEADIKTANKTRKSQYEKRDNLIFDQEVADVLTRPYNKEDVEDALKSFNDVETKEVLKKKELVKDYGKHTKNLREFLEKQKIVLASEGWKTQDTKGETYKKFVKGLKDTSYWKIYDNSTKKPSIPYLDRVMEQIMQQVASGLSNSYRYDDIINMLYTREY